MSRGGCDKSAISVAAYGRVVRSVRQRHGTNAEELAAKYLTGQGWTVVARNVKIAPRDEIDVVAIDTTGELVCVEVRSARSSAFGAPEERVDSRKVGHLYRAARLFARSDQARQLAIGGRDARVDLVIVDLRAGKAAIRHFRRLEPA